MFLFQLFRSLLPLHNPLGFGAADFFEFGLAAILLAAFTLARPIEHFARRLATKRLLCVVLLALTAITTRLALLPRHPVPTPKVADEFSHLLVADTLRNFRLANPTHPLHQFFETFFVLQEPTYSSIYPPGQGIALGLGWLIFGLPWAGVVLSTATFCALCYWMLRGWTTPTAALAGGILAVFEFGPLCEWMNGYWGGSLAASAGCLVFGALPRIREGRSSWYAAWLGLGFGVHLLTRPYETVFLGLSIILFFAPTLWRGGTRAAARPAAIAIAALLPAVVVMLLQNKQITGSWTTLPYVLSQYEYGVPVSLTFQNNPAPHRQLTPQQESEYQIQLFMKGPEPETLGKYIARLAYRLRFYRFFLFAPLYLAALAYLGSIRRWRAAWVLLTVAIFAWGTNFFPGFHLHYLAAITCLFLLISVAGLRRIAGISIKASPAGLGAARIIVWLCAGQFVFWYTMHVFNASDISIATRRYESWDGINHQNPERRIAVREELSKTLGKKLVFVRYYPQHLSQDEWVWNAAEIDHARVVWARDLGDEANQEILRYYPDRTAWMLEPDFRPLPRLTEYRPKP